ncbi:DUF4960 domain-containing protein [Paracnuella aquatica]|uniref:DUF4960 domain-containing protein n=1 Tax=Paracnuella aquatica TaxID=2268757 RepID=UPI000DEFC61F|nr:DUF4960 domain-containing protein [Paracnuella aquatica]RPD44184.1 DUF4960 domain-containing protein [Paracnuella aquatica]
MNKQYMAMAGLLLVLAACQKNDINVAPANIQPVSNLQYKITGDTALLTWNLPAGASGIVPTISDGSTTKTLAADATQYKFGVVETNKDYLFNIKLTDGKGNISLGEIVRFKREGAYPVQNLTAAQNDNGVLVSWTPPVGPVSKITVQLGSQTAELAAGATQHQFNNVPVGQYNISVVTTNAAGQASNTVYLPFKVGATAVAYLGIYADSTTLLSAGDDDEVAGGKWLFRNYDNARYISFDQIKNGTLDLSQFRVIWWNYDLQTTNSLPAVATDAAVLEKIKAFYNGGGNLLFNQFAARYFWPLGRMTDAYPMVIGGGAGFSNNDTWGIGVNVGKKHDQSSHPLFKGIAITTQPDGRKTFPVLGPGWREDHNTVIENIPGFLGLGPNDNESAYNRFVSDNAVEWLGQWDGIGDYWMAGIMELKPKGAIEGSAIWIGIGGIEWNQNSGTNLYQANIERLYKNAIDYLKTK